jgi:hypothetical protein
MKAEEMIDGRIYYLETGFKWLVRFKKLENDSVIGYGNISLNDSYFSKSYRNDIDFHKVIREATQKEEQHYISLSKGKENYKPQEQSNYLIFN